MSNGKNEHVRYQYLDALRGIAAVSVCFHHLFNYIYGLGVMSQEVNQILKEYILELFDFGRFGVVLFFLISGFIIPSSLKPGISLRKFLITRIFRLYPAFWIACTLIFLASILIFDRVIPVYQYLANLTMMPKIFHVPELSGVFWTLFIEILFYFGCAILFYFCWLENPVVLGVVAFLLHITTPLELYLNYRFNCDFTIRFVFYHLSFLFIGSVFRLAINNNVRQAKIIGFGLLLCTLVTVPLMTGEFFYVPEVVAADFVMHGANATTFGYFSAIAIFLMVSVTKYSFNHMTAELGKISYSMYLLHLLIFVTVAKIISPTSLINCTVYVLLCGLLTYAAAKFSFNFIEEPAIEFGRLVVRRANFKAD